MEINVLFLLLFDIFHFSGKLSVVALPFMYFLAGIFTFYPRHNSVPTTFNFEPNALLYVKESSLASRTSHPWPKETVLPVFI